MTNNHPSEVVNILAFFKSLKEQNFVTYDGRTLTLQSTEEFSIDLGLIKKVFKTVSKLPGNQVEILLLNSCFENYYFFFNEIDFMNRYSVLEDHYAQSNAIIFKLSSESIVKGINEPYSDKNKFIHNFHEFKQTLKLFLSTPELTPYKSDADKTFTIISKEKGVFNIGYGLPGKDYFFNQNLSGLKSNFVEEFTKKEFIQFFKEIIIAGVHQIPEKRRYCEIVKTSSTLLSLAQRDYETYVSSFAFDKIKSEFKSERELYFDSLDKSIASVGKQVVSFPLTFAATIFASYKVKDQPGILLLILLAYLLYSIVAFLILRMTSYNVKCLEEDVLSEENHIKVSYNVIFDDFKADFKKIKNKIDKLKIIIKVLYGVLIFLFILFSSYAIHTMGWVDLDSFVEWVPKPKTQTVSE
ncbi:hypothetical protein [Maribacter sp. 2307UL18-2]|uniref:hypothetical protein n=1 Tax=Maribacter sp. 2307UL18-2 TaxID=3386274 RepID=UPI0039BD3D28